MAAPPALERSLHACRAALGLVVLALGAVAVVGAGPPAGAHAVLVASSPGEGERLEASPESVTLTWSEPVSVDAGGIQVLDGEGRRVERGDPQVLRPDTVAVDLVPDLDEGTYLVSWRVISDDGHPVGGTVVFAVGSVLDDAALDRVPAGTPAADTLVTLARIALLGGALAALGLAVAAWFLHDGAPDRDVVLRAVGRAGAVGAAGATALVAVLAWQATGAPDGAVDPSALATVLTTGGLGVGLVVLAAGLVALAGSALVHDSVGAARVLAITGGIAVAGSFALWGHTATGELGVAGWMVDAVHVATAGLWIGGLLGVVLLVRSRAATEARPDVMGTALVVVRFSTLAAISVTALVAAGVAMAWSQVGEPADLVDTSYGRVLLAKVVVTAGVLVVAGWNRYRLVPSLLAGLDVDDADRAAPQVNDWTRLMRTMRVELVGLAVVVALTGALIAMVPPRSGADVARVYQSDRIVAEGIELEVVVAPASVGGNEIHLTYFDDAGRPSATVEGASVELSQTSEGLGPLEVIGRWAGPGHYIASVDLPAPGTWELVVRTQIGFEVERTRFDVAVGSA